MHGKRWCLWALVSTLCMRSLCAAELTFKLSPELIFPFLSAGARKWSVVGADGVFDAGVNLLSWLNVGAEAGFFVLPKENSSDLPSGADPVMFLVPVGLQAGAFFYPLSRLELGFGAALGPAMASNDGRTHYAPWYRVYGEAFFRINPALSVGLTGSWFDYQNTTYWGNPAVAGVTAGVSVKLKIDTRGAAGRVDASVAQEEPVFPLIYGLYRDSPLGTVVLENHETAEIRNVHVFFRAGEFTSSDQGCGSIPRINKHKSAELSVTADFGARILQFSEAGDIPAEVVVDYEILGRQRTVSIPVIIPVYNRNQMRWYDPAMAAAFISASSQEVMELSRYLVGIARNQLRSGLNRNMQFAMYVYEGVRLNGVECSGDTDTPYADYHLDPDLVDYIQYPFQTLMYKSGDADDVAILFMALLQAVGINTAFIPLDDDVIVCIDLGMTAARAVNLFDSFDRVLLVEGDDGEDEVWIPVAMRSLRDGFMNSWYDAVDEVAEADDLNFIRLSDAWQSYPPAGFVSGENVTAKPREDALIAAVETDMARYVTMEFGPQITAVQDQIREEGMSVQLLNRLGLLYVRAGLYASAVPVYERSAELGSVGAMNNLGNIATVEKRYEDARRWYEAALAAEPENATAQRGLNRVLGLMDE